MDELLLRRRTLMSADHDFSTPGGDGRIGAYYYTSSADQQVTLLYNTTSIGNTMEVDGISVSRATTYTFADTGYHLVKFTITGNLTNQFRACSALQKIYFPAINITGAMDYLFHDANNLEIVRIPGPIANVPGFNSSTAKRTSPPFADIEILNVASGTNCVGGNNIKKLVVKGTFSTMPKQSISGFNASSNFEEVGIESPNLTNVGEKFCMNSNALQRLIINVNTPPTLGSNAFQNNGGKPTEIYVPYSSDHSVLDAGKAASGGSSYASKIYELNPDGTVPV